MTSWLFRVRGLPEDVAALGLPLEPGAQGHLGVCVTGKKVDTAPTRRPDPSPFAHQGVGAEQRGFDGQHVVARHIAGIVDAIEDEQLDGRR